MIVYLMRHGEAGFDAPNDDMRQLTDRGRAKIEWNINQKRHELNNVEFFLSSPILRARQTAEAAMALLNREGPVTEVNWLIHESNPSEAIIELGKMTFASAILFSHQPFASRFVELFCGLEAGDIAMNTSSIIAMRAEPVAAGFGSILWQVS